MHNSFPIYLNGTPVRSGIYYNFYEEQYCMVNYEYIYIHIILNRSIFIKRLLFQINFSTTINLTGIYCVVNLFFCVLFCGTD